MESRSTIWIMSVCESKFADSVTKVVYKEGDANRRIILLF